MVYQISREDSFSLTVKKIGVIGILKALKILGA
jgi:hypothetical protein